MSVTSLKAKLLECGSDIWRAVAAAPRDPATEKSPEWFTGLAVAPTEFSEQLAEMQLSLQQANTAEGIPAKSVQAENTTRRIA